MGEGERRRRRAGRPTLPVRPSTTRIATLLVMQPAATRPLCCSQRYCARPPAVTPSTGEGQWPDDRCRGACASETAARPSAGSSSSATASLRERTPSFAKADTRWLLTVLSARNSRLGDLAVGQPCHEQAQDLLLAMREGRLGEHPAGLARGAYEPGEDRVHGCCERPVRRAARHEGVRACIERQPGVVRAGVLVARDDDDASGGRQIAHAAHGGEHLGVQHAGHQDEGVGRVRDRPADLADRERAGIHRQTTGRQERYHGVACERVIDPDRDPALPRDVDALERDGAVGERLDHGGQPSNAIGVAELRRAMVNRISSASTDVGVALGR